MIGAAEGAGGTAEPPGPRVPSKTRAAGLSIASNTGLISLKLVAGAVTGSVAIFSDAIHSTVDLLASIVAYVSVRKADQPADDTHRYGHEKVENLAAAIEGMLILAGSGVIVYESIRRLVEGGRVESLGFGIGVVAFAAAANFCVSAFLYRRARQTESPALAGDAAHLRTDAWSSLGVLVGLVLVKLTGAEWIDAAVALGVAGAIVVAGVRLLTGASRVLMDEALPAHEIDAVDAAVRRLGDRGVIGYHKLRTRRAGPRRHVDLHVQFRTGTSLEDAHGVAHELERAIQERLRNADVLIHLEPEGSLRPGDELRPSKPRGSGARDPEG